MAPGTGLSNQQEQRLDLLLRNESDTAYKRRVRWVLRRLSPQPGQAILDGGTGMGFYLKALETVTPGLRLAGVDLDPQPLGYAHGHLGGRATLARARLERMIDALALHDTVTLCGALRHGEVIKKYDDATLFALLCIVTAEGDMDGIPNVIAEAMAMRAPVVSTTVSAIPELVVDGVNGLLAPPGDATAAAAAIARLLDEPDLRQQLADNAQRTIEETFDVDCNVRRFAATLWPEWFTNLTIDG